MAQRTTVEVEGLKDMAKAFDRLPDQLGRAVQEALNETAVGAQRRLAKAFDREIESGPAAFTKIKPGSKTSSVFAHDRRYRKTSDPESSTAVQKKQARYLGYMLDEVGDGVQRPGEVGVADNCNQMPAIKNIGILAQAERASGAGWLTLPRPKCSRSVEPV